MKIIMEFLWLLWPLLWPLSGIWAHVAASNRLKTWCGTPVWQEPLTYVMFIPAMIAGPILFLLKD